MDISRYMDQHLNEIRPSIQFTVEVDDRGSLSNQGYRSKLFTHHLVQEPKVVPPEPHICTLAQLEQKIYFAGQWTRVKTRDYLQLQQQKYRKKITIDRSILDSVMNMPDLVRHIHCLREIFDVWQIVVVITWFLCKCIPITSTIAGKAVNLQRAVKAIWITIISIILRVRRLFHGTPHMEHLHIFTERMLKRAHHDQPQSQQWKIQWLLPFVVPLLVSSITLLPIAMGIDCFEGMPHVW